MRATILALVTSASILSLTATETIALEVTALASLCLDSTHGEDRAMCVAIISSIREHMREGRSFNEFRACSTVEPNDLSDTYAVIDWIHANPERQQEELFSIAAEALQQLHPCP
jgi:hypothetical protein